MGSFQVEPWEDILTRYPARAVSTSCSETSYENLKFSVPTNLGREDIKARLVLAWGLVVSKHTGSENVGLAIHQDNDGSVRSLDAEAILNKLFTVQLFLDEIQNVQYLINIQKYHLKKEREAIHEDTHLLRGSLSSILVLGGRSEENACVEYQRSLNNIDITERPPLMILCTIQDDSNIVVQAFYDSNSISKQLLRWTLNHFCSAFNQILSIDSRSTVSDLDVCTGIDRDQIFSWNRGAHNKRDYCVHELVSQRAKDHPTDIALMTSGRNFTYEEMDRFSTILAQLLCHRGVLPDTFVPFCYQRSPWTVIIMLAILKTGAAFVPLDPSSPTDRLKVIIKQTKACLILCSPELREKCIQFGIEALSIEADLFTTLLSDNLHIQLPQSHPDAAAYTIFTSGSTGRPKGVVVQHAAVCTSLLSMSTSFQVRSDTRALQFCAYTFDASFLENFAVLFAGGSLVIPTDEERMNSLSQFMNDFKVNWAVFVTSVAAVIDAQSLPFLKTVITGAEPIREEVIKKWKNRVKLIGAYGPTEACVACLGVNFSVPIVPALDNLGYTLGDAFGCWIVEPGNSNRLSPIGSIGELLISGPTLAREYLDEPEKTQASFISAPDWYTKTSAEPTRFYRTGDLVQYNFDGSIRYIDRIDRQVKVNGQRIEIGEVEHHVSRIPEVQNCLVSTVSSANNRKQLAAAITLTRSRSDAVKDVLTELPPTNQRQNLENMCKVELSKSLPSYMVPTLWYFVETFPTLSAGKLDRKQIQAWLSQKNTVLDESDHFEGDVDSAHSTASFMQQEWMDVLNVPLSRINPNASFLSLGGDSISAMQLVANCRKKGYSLTVREVLQCKSFINLENTMALLPSKPSAIFEDEEEDVSFDLSPIQSFHFQHSPFDPEERFTQGILLGVRRKQNPQQVLRSVVKIVKQHSALRTHFQIANNGQWKQRINSKSAQTFRFQHHELQSRGDVGAITSSSSTTLNARTGPVCAFDLIDVGGEQLLFMVAHHAIIDSVSWRIIIADIEMLLHHPDANLHSKPTSFQAWCKAQAHQASTVLDLEKLLPIDVPLPQMDYWGIKARDNLRQGVVKEKFVLDPCVTEGILNTSNHAINTEPIELMLSALMFSFATTFPDRPVATIYTEGHGREPWDSHIDISQTVGWFTTIFPVVVNGSPMIQDLVKTTKLVKDTRRSIPQNGRPYFAARYLQDSAKVQWQHHSSMEILFNFFGQFQQLERTDGLFYHTPEGLSETYSPSSQRHSLIEISSLVQEGKLILIFEWNSQMKHQLKLRQWVKSCMNALIQLSKQLQNSKPMLTLNDTPLMKTNYEALEEFSRDLFSTSDERLSHDIEEVYPCTPMQDSILLSQLQTPGTYLVNVTSEVVSLRGSCGIDVDRLSRAWDTVAQSQSILRTRFLESFTNQSAFSQVTMRNHRGKAVILKCADETVDEAFNECRQLSDTGLPNGFLIAVTTSGKVFCRLQINHALVDGLSATLIFRELTRAYDRSLEVSSAMRFRDFVAYMQDLDLSNSIAYWNQYVSGLEPCHFPSLIKHGRTDIAQDQKQQRKCIEIQDIQRLREVCEKNDVTLAVLFRTVWALILRQYTGEDEVCFGYLASLRDAALDNIEDAIGIFINMLVCKVSVKGDLGNLLQNLQKDLSDSWPHQYCSLAQITHSLQLSEERLFNTVINMQRASSRKGTEDNSLAFVETDLDDPSEFDVALEVFEDIGRITATLIYSPTMLSSDQASGILGLVEYYLSEIAKHTERTVIQVQSLTPSDKDQLIRWNSIDLSKTSACLTDLIWQQIHQTPKASAVETTDLKLTYEQLGKWSERVADKLIVLGVGPEVLVPFCLEKSPLAIVVMMAILRAGGACVAIEPRYPTERVQKILHTTDAKFMITDSNGRKMHQGLETCMVSVQDLTGANHSQSLQPLPKIHAEQAAFVVFTSGSTGNPKGIVLEHGSITGSLQYQRVLPNIDHTTRTYQFSSYTFDASIHEIFLTLMQGGTVCVPTESDRMNRLAASMRELSASLLHTTPTVVGLIKPAEVPSLKTIIVGGEALSKEVISTWSNKVRLVSQYGPAECSVACVSEIVTENSTENMIGTSMGAFIWVFNEDRLTPPGCVGELAIEGPGLARCYLKDPEKTTREFLENPPWLEGMPYALKQSAPNRRVYRTGDLVYHAHDGTLYYLGRKDNQVKLHGQRIELREIESSFSACTSTKRALAVVPKSGILSKKLTMVFSVEDGRRNDKESNKITLASDKGLSKAKSLINLAESQMKLKLPTYMVPSTWIPIEDIPLLPSGKLDRKSINQWLVSLTKSEYRKLPSAGEIGKEEAFTGDVIEEVLRDSWAAALNLDSDAIGLNQSFYGIGGDSISAMHAVSYCRAAGVKVSVKDILKLKTIGKIAQRKREMDVSVVQPPLSNDHGISESSETFPLSPIQMHFFERAPGGQDHFNQSFLLEIEPKKDRYLIQDAIEKIVSRHPMLRARYSQEADGKWAQQISSDISRSYSFADATYPDVSLASESFSASHRGLDSRRGPLFSANLATIDGGHQLLLLVAHHLVIDFVSWRIILRDLNELLSQTSSFVQAQPELSFRKWCSLQDLESQKSWLPSYSLPYDVPDADFAFWGITQGSNTQGNATSTDIALDVDTTKLLLGPSNVAFSTRTDDLLVAALFHSFGQIFTTRMLPTIFKETHGRETWDDSIDLSETVGWFTSFLPISLERHEQDIFHTIRQVKDNFRKAPLGGQAYFASRYLTNAGRKSFGNHLNIEILFNYLGQFQQLEHIDSVVRMASFQPTENDNVAAGMPRAALFEISAYIQDAQMVLNVAHPQGMRHLGSIRDWLLLCKETLRIMTERLADLDPQPTLCDFPLSPLSYGELEYLVHEKLPALGWKSSVEIKDIYPLSNIQEGIFLSQVVNADQYSVYTVWEVKVPDHEIDIERFGKAWDLVVAQQPLLRTIFIDTDLKFSVRQQVVMKTVPDCVNKIQLRDGQDPYDEITNLPLPDYREGQFLHRMTMVQLAQDHLLCRLDINHAITDRTSMDILIQGLKDAYLGRSSSITPNYRTFISYLNSLDHENIVRYWKTRLAGVQPCLFPTLATASTGTDRRSSTTISLSQNASSKLREFGRTQEITVAAIVQAAWAVVLRAYTGSDDVCFGYLASGRDIDLDGVRDTIGPFISMNIQRVNIQSSSSTSQLAGQVSHDLIESVPYQHVDLVKLLHDLDLDGQTLFNTILSHVKIDEVQGTLETKGLNLREVASHDPSEYLSVGVEESTSNLKLHLLYWTRQISDEQATAIIDTFSQAITSIVESPNSSAAEVNLISEAMWHDICAPNINRPLEVNACIHREITQQALRNPGGSALCAWDGNFDYSELDKVSTILAGDLQQIGVRPGTNVPVCFEKSRWAVVAMIAVLKAGGAIVPLDSTQSSHRLESIMKTCQAHIAISDQSNMKTLQPLVENIICLDQSYVETILSNGNCGSEFVDIATPEDVALILFTSGSTGEPKGVVLEHRAMVTSSTAHGRSQNVGIDTRVFQFAAFTFDVAMADIFTTLIHGGCICMPSEYQRLNDLPAAMNSFKANWAHMTPSIARTMNPVETPSLRILILGGEPMSSDIVAKWSPKVQLMNTYGPAECCVTAALNTSVTSKARRTDIGTPVGTNLWVVNQNDQHQLLPIGAVGELIIEGHTIGREYLNQPELTTATFIDGPKWTSRFTNPKTNTRYYQSGDLVRLEQSGRFTFIGRKGTTVKLHGRKVNLPAIESEIAAAFGRNHIVCAIPSRGLYEQRIVLVASFEQIIAPKDLNYDLDVVKECYTSAASSLLTTVRERISHTLAPHLIPNVWIPVSKIPLLPSGKVNRKVVIEWLHKLDQKSKDRISDLNTSVLDYVPPNSEVERELERIWSTVLHIEQGKIGMNRKFVELGGDSLLAMEVVAHARASKIHVTVGQVLKGNTIAELAVPTAQQAKSESLKVPEVLIETNYRLSPIQKQFFCLAPHGQNRYNQTHAMRLKGSYSKSNISQGLDAIVQQHQMLRARFTQQSPGSWRQFIVPFAPECYEFEIHPSHVAKSHPDENSTINDLDIENGPVFKAQFFESSRTLLLTAHHLVIDLVSWRIIEDDLTHFLENDQLLSKTPLPFLSWSEMLYKQFVSTKAAGPELPAKHYLDYWGMTKESNTFSEIAKATLSIDQQTTNTLMDSRNHSLDLTPAELILAGVRSAFSRVFKDRQAPVLVCESHGRHPWDDSIDLSQTVGWFTTKFPIAFESSMDSPLDVAFQIREETRRYTDKGLKYMCSKYSGNEHWQEDSGLPYEVQFNYIGTVRALEGSSNDIEDGLQVEDATVRATMSRVALFSISARCQGGSIVLEVDYNPLMKHQDTIQMWLKTIPDALTDLGRELESRSEGLEVALRKTEFLHLTPSHLDILISKELPMIGVTSLSDVETILPCTPIQNGVLLSRLRNAEFYQSANLFQISTKSGQPLDYKHLQSAWQAVVDRHQLLRCIFMESPSSEGSFLQVILKSVTASVSLLNHDNEESLVKLECPYTKPSLERHRYSIRLYLTPSGKAFLNINMDHAILDGRSWAVLLEDLALAYASTTSIPDRPLYSAYVKYLKSQTSEAARNYWENYLHGVNPCHFPDLSDTDHTPNINTIRIGTYNSAMLSRFARQTNMTPGNIFRLSWAIVLRAWTSSDEVCFGYMSAGRDAPVDQVGKIFGPLINTLICRVQFKESNSLFSLASQLQSELVDALPYQHYPLAQALHALDLHGAPLFNTIVNVQTGSAGGIHSETDLAFTDVASTSTPDLDLTFNVGGSDKNLEASLLYWTSRVSEHHAMSLATSVSKVLDLIIEAADMIIDDIDLVSNMHVQKMLEWNQDLPAPSGQVLHQKFLQHVQDFPNAPAIASALHNLTYEQLDRYSGLLANHLIQALGNDSKQTFVPLCFEKSALTVIAMLAVLRAGRAFVNLDPAHPPARLRQILDTLGAPLAICSSANRDLLQSMVQTIVIVDDDLSMLKRYDQTPSMTTDLINPDHPAYVIFTSGSTGTPKGTILSHRAVTNSIAAQAPAFAIDQHTRSIQFSSYTFDACIAEIWTVLSSGGCVCVPTDHERLNDLPKTMTRLRVNWMFSTPSFALIMHPEDVPGLETLVVGGEVVGKAVVDQWKDQVNLIGGYGPTETCVFCTSKELSTSNSMSNNIGRGIGCRTWVISEQNDRLLAPIGTIGELVIEGPALFSGYLNRPEETASAVLQNPTWYGRHFSSLATSGFMYKTGDLVRYNSSGELLYMGRKTNQVKIRGQRLELDEVEHALNAHLGTNVPVCAEVLIPKSSTMKKLVAFLCYKSGDQALTTDATILEDQNPIYKDRILDIHQSLSNRLPSYMVPSAYVVLQSIPCTSSGKIDRKRLRLWGSGKEMWELSSLQENPTSGAGSEKLTALEIKLQSLWSKVLELDLERIRRSSNFFRLGGDSISAVKLVAMASTKGLKITVADVFSRPLLKDLSAVIEKTGHTNTARQYSQASYLNLAEKRTKLSQLAGKQCQLSPNAIQEIIPCLPLQEGLISLSIQEAESYRYQHIEKLPKDCDLQKFRKAWEDEVKSNSILRTRIVQLEEVGCVQVIIDEDLPWQEGSLSLAEYLSVDEKLSFDLGQRFVRLAILQSPDQDHLVFTAHHAIYDGWSLPRIFDNVRRRYAGLSVSKPAPFNSFVEYVKSNSGTAAETYWREYLSDSTKTFYPSRSTSLLQMQQADSTVSERVHLKNPRRQELTIATVIRAAWALVLSKYSGKADVIFGATLSGRNAPVPEVADIFAPTITTVPVRARTDPSLSVQDFLHTVQSEAIAMMPYEHFGLQNIRKLGVDCEDACDFQTLLVIQPGDIGKRLSCLGHPEDTESETMAPARHTYPLTITATSDNASLIFGADFISEIIDESQVLRLLQTFGHIVNCLLDSDESAPLRTIDCISSFDRQQILQWNTPQLPSPFTPVHEQIKNNAFQNPQQTAITAWDGNFTYEELDHLSTQYAQYLIAERGVEKHDKVAILFEKSKLYPVIMIAIMKAGATFVPLDVDHPPERLKSTVTRLQPKLVVVSSLQSTKNLLDQLVDEDILDQEKLTHRPRACSLPIVDSSDLVYILFTSGSTGIPKGVMIEHGALAISTSSHGGHMKLDRNSRVLQFAAYTWDVSILEVLTTLKHQACVCIPSDDDRMNDLSGFIRTYHVNTALLTPSVAKTLRPDDLCSVHTLILAGEDVSADLIGKWTPRLRLVNGYGPTECCIITNMRELNIPGTKANNIGNAVGCSNWVTDPDDPQKLTPIGGVGELLIGGPMLARGYLDDQVKTTAAFVEAPDWIQQAGVGFPSRFYRTGDLVHYNNDGSLQYVGRIDSQVKIRGQRVELSEILSHLLRHEKFKNGLVLLPKQGIYANQLVAVLTLESVRASAVVPKNNGFPTLLDTSTEQNSLFAELHDHLMSILPSYMVPNVWIAIQDLPLSVSGKLATSQVLKLLDDLTVRMGFTPVEQSSLSNDTAPKNHIQRVIQNAWSQTLHIPPTAIPLSASFASLGGDSIGAMLAVSACRKHGVKITVKQIMQLKSIMKLSVAASHESKAVKIRGTDEVKPGPSILSPIQKMHLSLSSTPINHFNQTEVFYVGGNFEEPRWRQSMQRICQRHAMLRARFLYRNQQWMQTMTDEVDKSFRFRFHTAHLTHREISAAISDSQRSLNIEHGPLAGIDIFNSTDQGACLVSLTIHHLVVDIVSRKILLEDLEELLTNGHLSSPVTTSFSAWSEAQVELVNSVNDIDVESSGPVESVKLDYWGLNGVSNTYSDSEDITFSLQPETTTRLFEGSQTSLGAELIDVLIGALLHSFALVFEDREPPWVFNENHGREPWNPTLDVTRTVGWFTTMSPFSCPPAELSSIRKTIAHVKDLHTRLEDNGLKQFAWRYLTKAGLDAIGCHLPMEILLNFHGGRRRDHQGNGLFWTERMDWLSNCEDVDPQVPRYSLFDVLASMRDESLHFRFIYNRGTQRKDQIHRWVDAFETSLNIVGNEALKQSSPKLLSIPSQLGPSEMNAFTQLALQSVGIADPSQIQDVYNCTPMQKHILQSQQRNEKAYIVCLTGEVVPLHGQVSSKRLAHAWELIEIHHAILRTRLVKDSEGSEEYRQVVLREQMSEKVILHAKTRSEAELLLSKQSITSKLAAQPFQFSICSIDQDAEVLAKLEISHALIDHVSISVIMNDLVAAYNGDWDTSMVPLPFRGFVDYINQHPLSREASQLWSTKYSDLKPSMFPTVQASSVPNGGGQWTSLQRIITKPSRFRRFSETCEVSPANIWQTLWSIILFKYTKDVDVCFGFVTSGRDVPLDDVLKIVGPFLDFQLNRRRLQTGSSTTVADLARGIQADFLEMLNFPSYEFSTLCKERVNLFNTMVNYRNQSLGSRGKKTSQSSLNGGRWEWKGDDKTSSLESDRHEIEQIRVFKSEDPWDFDLVLEVNERPDHFEYKLCFWTSRVDLEVAQAAADDIERLMQTCMEYPDALVSDIIDGRVR